METHEINRTFLKKILIFIIALIGFATTVKLAIIYFDSNFNPYALPSFCSVNKYIDCDGVAQTTHSQFFGIPLAYWGMFLYLFIAFMLFVDKLKNVRFLHFLKVFKHPLSYIAALGYISFAISMILAGVSLFEIKKICILCVFTYLLNLIIALVATTWYKKEGAEYTCINAFWAIYKVFKTSIQDFFRAIKVRKYLISLLILLTIATSFLAYTTLSFCFTPQVKRYLEIKKYVKMKENPFTSTGNILGDKDAKLTVYIYTDYRCPICKTYNLIVCRAAEELNNIKIIHKNFPLDNECNRYLRESFHEGSCMLARYSIAAQKQNKLWDINSEFFEKEPKDEKAILKIAKSMDLDTKKLKEDANSKTTEEELKQDIEDAVELRITGTPALVVNGKIYNGIQPYYELKEIFIKAGAVEKQQQK